MLSFFKRNWLVFAGLALGALGGYLYWMFIGCQTGRCLITSSPLYSAIWGAAFGALLFNAFKKTK